MVFVAVIAAVALGAWLYRAHMDRQLLTIQTADFSERPDLVRYAASIAAPAYRRNCASCHGADLKGDPVLGAPNLIDKDWLYGDTMPQIEQTILYGVRSGHPKTHKLAEMPAFAHPSDKRMPPLSPAEISDLTEFVVYLGGRKADPAAVTRGSALYANKGGCYDCHTPDGEGDQAIGAPNLTDQIWLRGDGSRKDIYFTIAEGMANVCPAWTMKLNALTVRALAIYVQSKAHQASALTGSVGKSRAN